MSRRPRRLETSKATWAAPSCEVPSLRRSRRPHHAGKERVGTWETSCRPQPLRQLRAGPGSSRERRRPGWREGSDGCVVPRKPRTKPTRSVAESVEGRRPVGGKARRDACPGHSAGFGMSPERRAYGPEVNGPPKPRTPVAFDLRQEPGAGKPHAGICGGGAGTRHLYPTRISEYLPEKDENMGGYGSGRSGGR